MQRLRSQQQRITPKMRASMKTVVNQIVLDISIFDVPFPAIHPTAQQETVLEWRTGAANIDVLIHEDTTCSFSVRNREQAEISAGWLKPSEIAHLVLGFYNTDSALHHMSNIVGLLEASMPGPDMDNPWVTQHAHLLPEDLRTSVAQRGR